MNPLVQRVVAAFGAHSFGQAINIFIQLASLPLFLTKWNTQTYGVWLLLTAMPAYLSMADGGLVTAAANKLSIEYARGQKDEARRIFQSAFVFIVCTCSAIWLLVALVVMLAGVGGLSQPDQQRAVLFLATGVLMAQFNGLAETIFRASGKHAQGIMLGNCSRLFEFCGWMLGLFAAGSFAAVAATGLLFRFCGLMLTVVWSARLHSGIDWGFRHATRQEVGTLIRPAMSFMAFPLSNALGLQGVTLLVGHLLGPAAVTVFNTYRTISRVALQVTGTLGNSLWAEFSRLYAVGGSAAVQPVYSKSFRMGAFGALAMSGVLAVLAEQLLALWSHKKIGYDATLMGIMLLYAAIGGLWNVPRVLLMSINKHGNLSLQAVAGAVASLCMGWALGHWQGLNGVAAAVLIVESGLAMVCIMSARKFLRTH